MGWFNHWFGHQDNKNVDSRMHDAREKSWNAQQERVTRIKNALDHIAPGRAAVSADHPPSPVVIDAIKGIVDEFKAIIAHGALYEQEVPVVKKIMDDGTALWKALRQISEAEKSNDKKTVAKHMKSAGTIYVLFVTESRKFLASKGSW